MLNIIIKIIGIIIPIIILLIYLIMNNAIYDFIDYCILGIKTFSNKIPYSNLLKSEFIVIKILSVCVPISIVIMTIYAFIKNNNKLLIIALLSGAEFVVAFPISDNIHFLIGSVPALVGIVYFIYLIEKDLKVCKNQRIFFKFFFEYLANMTIMLVLIWGIYKNYKSFINTSNYSTLEHFRYIAINEELEQTIKLVDDYIQNSNKHVYILNFDAAIYMIPINKYNKNYDMFLKGNIGSKGEKGQIEKIKSEDAKYLIVKDGIHRNWQNPEYVREYIKNNMNKTGEIENFEIYEN